MKLGLITDIHEHVGHLRTALARFQAEGVDQIVVIGDVFEMGERIEETCQLLAEAGAIGVWGNHDFGLCVDPDDEACTKYSECVIDFMTSLKPRLDIADCHFTHIEPWLDPESLEDLWYFEGAPSDHGNLERIFDAVPNRLMFVGHYHRWMLARPAGIADWRGESPIRLTDGRFFVVVGALCEGRYAILDSASSVFEPCNEADS